MYQYRQIIFRMRMGESDRQIAKSKLMGRLKCGQVREIAEQKGWLESVPLPEDAVLAQTFESKKPNPTQQSLVEAHAEQVKQWWQEGIKGTTIHQALVSRFGFMGAYSSVRRFLKKLTLDHPGLVAAPTVTLSDGTACAAGDDYTVNRITGTITRVATSAVITSDTAALKVSYEYGDPGKITADDIVGGIDAASGAKSGLELVDQVFPRFGMIPGLILAPGWSDDPLVAAVMSTKAANINGHFRAMAVVDIPCDASGVTKYSDASAWKALNNYVDNTMVVCWPLVKLQGKVFHLSTQAAGIMAQVDYANDDVPYESPSNKPLECNGAQLADGTAVWLGPDEANYLNSQGITTANNFNGVWRLWGNRTGAYPAVTDVKDAFTCIQRMFNWLGNEFILTFWQKVDKPLNRRLIETIVDSYNIRLNGLAARQFILGGRVEFLPEENPFTDLMDGVVNFHLHVTPPSPARDITALIEYDPGYLSTLFS